MAIDEETREALGAELYEALRSGSAIDPITDRHELTVADAYDVQSAFVERLRRDGASVVGHKIGLTSEGIRAQLGVDEPDFGRLLDTMFVDERTVTTADLIAPRVEPEIGFVLDADLPATATYRDVLAATDAVVPVAEIIDSRIRDWELEIEDTVADNGSSGRFVVGEQFTDVSGRDLSLEGATLRKNGELVEAGVGANVLEHPARAVAWLADALADTDESLSAGDIVLSGSFTPAVDLAPGDVVTLEFTSLGTLTFSVS